MNFVQVIKNLRNLQKIHKKLKNLVENSLRLKKSANKGTKIQRIQQKIHKNFKYLVEYS